ncbi:hypothetical protein [Thermopetrobacter sp. TC1]|uniref:hypothetical protein n=1 Tax=Thermopetrobacter sp. TC1 TaxID=1495045 RepID=UPI0006892067|nr:hypothetical protein [Thermopetrobacter sp. TC1]
MIIRTWKSLPRLVRFILRNIAIGVTIGWSLLAGILYADVGGLYSMISHSSYGFAAMFLLIGGFAVTFGPAAVASAVLMGYEFKDDSDLDKASKAPAADVKDLAPALLKARSGR